MSNRDRCRYRLTFPLTSPSVHTLLFPTVCAIAAGGARTQCPDRFAGDRPSCWSRPRSARGRSLQRVLGRPSFLFSFCFFRTFVFGVFMVYGLWFIVYCLGLSCLVWGLWVVTFYFHVYVHIHMHICTHIHVVCCMYIYIYCCGDCLCYFCSGPSDEVGRLVDLGALRQQCHEEARLLARVDGCQHLQRRHRALVQLELPHHLTLSMGCGGEVDHGGSSCKHTEW